MIFVISKKKILLIIFIIVVISSLVIANNIFNNKNIVSVSSTPIAKHIIVIDAGHGFPDGGATNESGIVESSLNLEVALKLQKYLELSGSTVILTRSDENGIYDADANTIREQKISDMKNRVKVANDSNAEIFISIHMNKLPQEQYSGWQTFYKNNDLTSKNIATFVQQNLNSFMGKNNARQIKSISGIYLTKNVEIPMVLVECGFLSNKEEALLLQDEIYQNKLAWSIYAGLMDWYANYKNDH